MGDINGDGPLDVAAVNQCFKASPFYNDGHGGLVSGGEHGHGYVPVRVALSDLDSDGDTDIAYTNWGIANVTDTFADGVSLLRNRGDATFDAPVLATTAAWPRSIAAADLDVDGDLDLATANQNGNNVSILRNTGGSFTSTRVLAAGNRPHDLVLARLDGDARPDLAVIAFNSSRLTVITNPGA